MATTTPLKIPSALRIELLLGNFLYIIAWTQIVFIILVFWHCGILRDNEYRFRDVYRGRLIMTSGIITRLEDTGAAYGSYGGGRNGIGYPIYRVSFTFSTPDRQHTGTSYFTHHHHGNPKQGIPYQRHDQVMVEYPPGRPAFARMHGLRHNKWETSAVNALYLVVGLGLLVILLLFTGSPRLRRLQRSLITQARFTRCDRKVSKQKGPYYLGAFSFSEQSQVYTVEMRRYDRPWEKDDTVYVLYDPKHPDTGRPFTDTLTKYDCQIDATGEITVPYWFGKWELIPPALAVIALLLLLCDL